MTRRAEILQELVRYERPTHPLLEELRTFGWDWDGEPLLILRKDDLLSIIGRFLSGGITATQLQQWAENLECREDVAFDSSDQELIDGVFFRLAAPFINEPLTTESVTRMKHELLGTIS